MDNFFGDFLKQLQERAGIGSGAAAANTVISSAKTLIQKRQDVAQPVATNPAPLSSPIQSNTAIEANNELQKQKMKMLIIAGIGGIVLLALVMRR